MENMYDFLLQNEELDQIMAYDIWPIEEPTTSGYNINYDSSSSDKPASESEDASKKKKEKSINSERSRREKLKERLHALRLLVPKITKMYKASIINDAITYLQDLHEEEKKLQQEIMELEYEKSKKLSNNVNMDYDFENEILPVMLGSKRKRIDQQFYQVGGGSSSRTSPPIEVLELRVHSRGEKTLEVNITCSEGTNTIVKLCEAFESLKLKIITTNITAVSGRLFKTAFVEASEEEKDDLKAKIETAIAVLNS